MLLFTKNRGAISVFLVIILVPCMLIASIFVDISRVELSKAVAESSADLALSTLMTNYDYDLCEYYGLMGSCQNISEYYSTVSEYYDIALHSQDVDSEEIKLLYQRVVNDIGGRFRNETISDILRIQNQTEGNAVGPIDGANMYNATIMQEQVVEFMKYRAPIVILQEIIDKLNSDPSVSQLLENDENKNLVEDKSDFYEAEGELLKAAFDVYWMTRDYTDKVGNNGENMSVAKLQQYAQDMNHYRSVYQEIHRYLVSNLMNTSALTGVYSRVTIDLEKYKDSYDKTNSAINSGVLIPTPAPTATPDPSASTAPAATAAPTPEPIYYIDGDKVTSLLNELTTAKNNFVTAKNNFINASSSLMSTLPGEGDSDAHAIQWWVQMNNAVNASGGTNYTTELSNKADALVKAYAKVLAITDCEPGNNMPEDWENKRTNLLNDVKSIHGQYLVAGITNSTDGYLNAVNKLEQVSAANLSKIQPQNLYVTVDGQSRSLPDALVYIRQQLEAKQTDVLTYIGLLNKLLDTAGGSLSPMDNLYSKAGDYATTLNTWSSSANASTTTMGSENRDEIESVKNMTDEDKDSTELCVTIDREAVDEMKNRLVNIRSQYKVICDAIEGMKYGSSRLLDIADTESMKSNAGAVVIGSEIGLTNQQVSTYADSTFSQLFHPAEGDIAVLHDVNDNGYDPLMSPVTEQVDTPDLYLYMHRKFKDSSRDAVEEAEKEQENAKKQKEEKEKEKDKDRYHGKGTDITSTESSSGNGYSFAKSAMTGLIGLVRNLVEGEVDNLRDNLYVTTYIMNMFSYATFETEGYYSLLEDDKKTQLKLSTYETIYQEKKGDAGTEGTWLSADVEDTYNKTLTNKLINQENNAAYLAEVEYILYGKSNVDSVKAAYNDIFMIRYALNLVSAFANFWKPGNATGNVINSIATAIAAATAGVIPAALTKVILLPILTIFETCKDLDRLEAGFPVEIYKSADDWWYSFQSDTKMTKVSEFMSNLGGDRTNPGKGLQYSDYLTLFVYLGLQSEDTTSEKMYLRMGDVIQANMRKATNSSEYSLTKTQVYFKIETKLRVDPLMLTLPYYTDYVDDPTLKDDWCTFSVETIRGY